MKVLIHYGDRIEETVIDCSEAPQAIEMQQLPKLSLSDMIRQNLIKFPTTVLKAYLSGTADGFPIYRFLPEKAK